MMSTSSPSASPMSMAIEAGYAWRSNDVDIVMLDAATRSRMQTPPLLPTRPLKRTHSPALSPRPTSPCASHSHGPSSKRVKPLPRTTPYSPKRAIAERQATPAPTLTPTAMRSKPIPAKPLLHRLTQTVTPLTTIEPLGLELEKVFAVGVGHGLAARRVREGSRLGRVSEADDMEWE